MSRQFKQYKALNIFLTALFVAAVAILAITFCISLPIYCRFFYYIQIKTLGLEQKTGWDYATIKKAYDEVLNFCTLPGGQFSAGALKFSEEGAAHFADCKALFSLNFWLMFCSAVATVALAVLNKLKIITILKPLGRRAYFYSAIIAIALPLIVGALCAIDFDKAFEVFHTIFFPGKSNWVFDYRYDEIILVMPEEFFMNCAIIIGVFLVAVCAGLIAADVIISRKERKKAQTGNEL